MPGLYLHIPFCLQKCHYCNFYSVITSESATKIFLQDLKTEIQLYAANPFWRKQHFDTVYLGGGTPSILTEPQLRGLLELIHSTFQIKSEPEVTLEVNPETVNRKKLAAFQKAGVNRLNIGVQSFDPGELKLLNRIHDEHQAKRCLMVAREIGFSNVGADLIFGVPGQSVTGWAQNLTQLLEFQPEHISTYGLTIEPETFLAREIQAGRLATVSEEVEREMYLRTIEMLTANGYEHYEISNFAKPGFRSRHNQIYWRNEPYLGLGPSAHSFAPPLRFWNVADVHEYHQNLAENHLPVSGQEDLARDQEMLEWVFLGLRRAEGIDLKGFEQEFSVDFLTHYQSALAKVGFSPEALPESSESFLIIKNERLKLTQKGLLVYNEICSQFV